MGKRLAASIARWRTARRMTLAAIVLAGGMATVGAATYRLATVNGCQARQITQTGYTYPGIGVELEQHGDEFIVRRVFPNTPADGKLFPNARLVAADGQSPETMAGWTSVIRGQPGTEVELEVAYGCGGPQHLTLQRDIIHLRY
jgi:C-terminal processing protease CtpA/Prc